MELKTLRLRQRVDTRTTLYDNTFIIPTFTEILDLVEQNYIASDGHITVVYAELKNPAATNTMFNVSMEHMVLEELEAHGYATKDVSQDLRLVQPVLLQCKEADSLRTLRTLTDIPLQQLMNSNYVWSDAQLDEFAVYAQGVGPDKSFFYGAGVELEEARR